MSGERPPVSRMLTGAQATAEGLRARGVSTAFAYPGTSELALCAASSRSGIRVLNARGDKEAVFMAGGFNAVQPGAAVAVLHGARSLTNALGAIADIRRSELPVVCLVGMASRASAPYLPPHAEPGLITHAGQFASRAVDCNDIDLADWLEFARRLDYALQPVAGPALFGLPQDLAASPFVPHQDLPAAPAAPGPAAHALAAALEEIHAATRPVILVDDYFLKAGGDAERTLGDFAQRLAAPVYQVEYRRGPMLFQRLRPDLVPTLRGPYHPDDPDHADIVHNADLLITVEDRNMYPRVVGPLPSCRKIAITSRADVTRKNGYLTAHDGVVEGDAHRILRHLARAMPPHAPTQGPPVTREETTRPADSPGTLVAVVGHALAEVARPHIVDDSQMFGGLVARHYRHLPPQVTIFGSHGGFVGGGLATAAGVASACGPVLCLLGDQGFTNGVGALAAVGELRAPVVALVCNNGSSVSLRMQAAADGLAPDESQRTLLGNGTQMNYAAVGRGYGIDAQTVRWTDDEPNSPRLNDAAERTLALLIKALRSSQPYLLELVVPDTPSFWAGVWSTAGHEGTAAALPHLRSPG